MQVSVESGEGLERRLSVELPAEQVDKAVNEKLQSLSRTVRLDGFRPGKVPMRVLKQRFGQQVRGEVYGDLIQQTFYEAAAGEDLAPAGEPHIEVKDDGENFSYTATFEVLPAIEVAAMDGVSISRPVSSVEDSDVDAMIDKLRRQRTIWNDVERASQDGDTVWIDFEGKIDGEVFDGGSAENVPLVLGSGAMIEGFESGLLGASKEEARTLYLTFPEEYRAEHLAGKDVVFDVKVTRVAEPELPEINEDFIKALGIDGGDEAELRTEVTSNMNRELKQKLESKTKERVMDKILEINNLEIPRALIEQESKALKQQTEQEMAQQGQQGSLDLPLSVFEPQAERRVKLGLLIGEIVKQQSIELDKDRVNAAIEDAAQSYETPQDVIDYYNQNPETRAGVENKVLEDQVVDWILDQMTVEDEQLSFDEIMGNDNQA
ncbi:MAG: trigger factor [bacterium]